MVSKGTILIIDDDPATLDTFTDLFLAEGFEKAIGAVTGKWAVDLIEEKKPDVVLLNVTIVGEDSLATLKKIKIAKPLLPVIVFADESNKSMAEEALKSGATSYIIKSLPAPEIIESVRSELTKGHDLTSAKQASILIVDDDKLIADMVKDFLERDGYNCLVLYDSKKVIDVVKRHKPRQVFLDIVMPDIDGIELLQQIKKVDKNIKVIMMSGISENDICISAVKKGASGYITKPFSLQQLKVTLLSTLID